jgi:uncharacterized protein
VIPPGQVPGDKTLPTPNPAEVQVIRSYGPGRFLIGQREWHGAVLVRAEATVAWSATRAEELSLEGLAALRQGRAPVEIVVFGCGVRAVPVAPAVRTALKSAGLALEVVDTGSACRIYNVLLAEGRRVGAALIPL